MEYRYVFFGCLQVGPSEDNLLTEAVKTKNYLVRIVTPTSYKTREDAEKDDMEYEFYVYDEEPIIVGIPLSIKKNLQDGSVPWECPRIDVVHQNDWTKYRMIRLKEDAFKGIGELVESPFTCAKPTGKEWKKIFPMYCKYPITKVAWSIIGISDVEEKEEGEKVCRFR